MSDELTDHDVSMILYFITEKGDITRWSSWTERRSVIERDCPDLIYALQRVQMADSNLRGVLERLDKCVKHDQSPRGAGR